MAGRCDLSSTSRLLVVCDSPVHRMPAEVKLVGLAAFVSVVAVTPRYEVWAFAVHGCLLTIVCLVARLSIANIAGRSLVAGPFVAAAALMPFIGEGVQVAVGPLRLSIDGLWAAWNICAKAVLGVIAGIVLTSTTPIAELLAGLTRMRMPASVVAIAAFMVRYIDLVESQLRRMQVAMVARGHNARWFWQSKPFATAIGTLFVRTYERGERVHDAMLARGFNGKMPQTQSTVFSREAWLAGLAVPTASAVATIAAIVI